MAFGYSFEVRSTMAPPQAKASIHSKWKNWFAIDDGPRGWIVGPLICLWAGFGRRQGPSVVAWISDDEPGTLIRGRAGRGLVQIAALMALAAFLVIMTWRGQAPIEKKTMWSAPFVVMAGLLWGATSWLSHDADPLVRFLRLAVGEEKPKPRRTFVAPDGPLLPMELVVDSNEIAKQATPEQVRWGIESIEGKGANGFLVLSRDEQHYMQAAHEFGGFMLEKREGGRKSHFKAVRESAGAGNSSRHFTADEVTQALFDYLNGRPQSPGIRWEPL